MQFYSGPLMHFLSGVDTGRVPTEKEIDQVFFLARVMYKAVLGLHYKRKEQKKQGQLAIF